MKSLFSSILFVLVILSSCQDSVVQHMDIIPKPQEVKFYQSHFKFDSNTYIAYEDNDGLQQQASYFSDLIFKTNGFNLDYGNENKEKNIIKLVKSQTNNEYAEAYELLIEKNIITISASDNKGIFYGLQSLFQLILSNTDAKEQISIPCMEINDKPEFKYRGMHLDVARHMFPVDFVKKYIDLLALYKFNTFHWHLTEDQGWRIEIKQYPELTNIGAWRKETLIGHGGKKPFTYDGEKYGGYYTQEEIKDIVAYASQRQITVIPEIEMPGHSLAALSSYPELGCTGGPYEVACRWGVFEDIYCSKEETFVFLENVLTEVMELFPSKYIHIGGDEAPKARWKECDVCQATIKREGLEDEHELQSYFIQRMEKFLNSHGREIIGWDEILEGGLAPNATVMSWRGEEGGIAAAKQGHDAIMTPWSHCYFDHYQADSETEPLAIGGFTSLEKVYSYYPIPDTLNENESNLILGTQANVWTEYMKESDYVEYMVLPRLAALAEVNWTLSKHKDWDSFKRRMDEHFLIYQKLGYNYCDHPY